MAGEKAGDEGYGVGVGRGRQLNDRMIDGNAAFDEPAADVGQHASFDRLQQTSTIQAVDEEDDDRPVRPPHLGIQADDLSLGANAGGGPDRGDQKDGSQ